MNFKTKTLGLVATGLVALGMTAPALAADGTTASQPILFTITSTDQFSVAITGSTDFQNEPFTIDPSTYNFAIQGFYGYQVTDLRGQPLGWNVSESASTFVNTSNGHTVADAELYSGNVPKDDPNTPEGFTWVNGSNPDGVAYAQSSVSIIPDGHVILHSNDGVTPPNNQVQGAGIFDSQEALYLTFPSAVEAGEYSSTITLTLSSGDI
jgi:hypothetical protein